MDWRLKLIYPAASVLVFLGVWQVVAARFIDPFFLPSPLAVLKGAGELLADGTLAKSIGASMARILAGWLLGSLAGAWTANRIARTPLAGWIVAGLFVLLTAYNFTIIPHPMWMMAAGILIPLVAAWIASRMARPAVI